MPLRFQKPGNTQPALAAPIKPFFRAALQPDGTLEMMIYEEIGYNFWTGEGVTAKSVKEQIDQAGPYSKIAIRINSPGGDAFEGLAIHNLIRAQGKPVDVFVDGIAASSASIIAMAGDTITMGHNALMMIHNAWTMCVGYAADMRKMADVLDKISASIAQTYVDRTKQSMKAVLAMMDAKTWMSAEDCVRDGFATQIAPQPDEGLENRALTMARNFKALRLLKNTPQKLKNGVACTCDCENCIAGECENCTNAECMDQNCMDCPMQEGSASAHFPTVPIQLTAAEELAPAITEVPAEEPSNPMQEQAAENKKKAAADFDLCEAVWQARQRGIDITPPEAIWDARQNGTDVADQQA